MGYNGSLFFFNGVSFKLGYNDALVLLSTLFLNEPSIDDRYPGELGEYGDPELREEISLLTLVGD